MKRHKNPNLPKRPQKGELVSIVAFDGSVVPGHVRKTKGGNRFEVLWFSSSGGVRRDKHTVFVHRKYEGVSWARGHDTDAAKALAVSAALRLT